MWPYPILAILYLDTLNFFYSKILNLFGFQIFL